MPNTPPPCSTSVADASALARAAALAADRDLADAAEEPRGLRVVEVLGLGHERDPAPQDERQEDRVEERTVVRGEDDRAPRGRFSRPSTLTRKHTRRIGVSTALTTQYSNRAPSPRPRERRPMASDVRTGERVARSGDVACCERSVGRLGSGTTASSRRASASISARSRSCSAIMRAALSRARCELRSYRKAVQDRASLVCIRTSIGKSGNFLESPISSVGSARVSRMPERSRTGERMLTVS